LGLVLYHQSVSQSLPPPPKKNRDRLHLPGAPLILIERKQDSTGLKKNDPLTGQIDFDPDLQPWCMLQRWLARQQIAPAANPQTQPNMTQIGVSQGPSASRILSRAPCPNDAVIVQGTRHPLTASG
jgi:hypothetical protein